MTEFVPHSLQEIAHENGISTLNSIEFAEFMDSKDHLKHFQSEFLYPKTPEGKRPIYLCGNSLGLQPKSARKEMEAYLLKWEEQGVHGHHDNHNGEDMWIDNDLPLRKAMSRLVGALESEVVIMNSLTMNLHCMMVSFYRPTATRFKILMEKKAFPSDYHAIVTQIQSHGFHVESTLIEVAPREGEVLLRHEDIEEIIAKEGDSIALILFSGIHYYTGQLFDMKRITEWGKAKGCKVGFDLAHAVGNVPLKLHDWDCDFACWCTYKYMNCGPGCIGGCFVNEKYGKVTFDGDSGNSKFPVVVPHRMAGWFGHRRVDRFDMEPQFIPEEGAAGFRASNPPAACIAFVKASLEIFDKAGIDSLREKSLQLTAYLEYLLQKQLGEYINIFTPSDPSQRGCQLSLHFKSETVSAHEVLHALEAEGIFGDVRKPGVIRIAPTPLYNSFRDVFDFVHILKTTLLHT